MFACRFLNYRERKHDGGKKKIGRRIALLACSSVRFAAQREKWEGPHNRALANLPVLSPTSLLSLFVFVCLSVGRLKAHSLVRFSPFGKKRLFFFFYFYFQEDSVRLVVSSLVAPCHLVRSLLRPRASFLSSQKIQTFFLREEKLLDARRHQSKGLVPWFTAPEVSIYLNVLVGNFFYFIFFLRNFAPKNTKKKFLLLFWACAHARSLTPGSTGCWSFSFSVRWNRHFTFFFFGFPGVSLCSFWKFLYFPIFVVVKGRWLSNAYSSLDGRIITASSYKCI